jgi:hypothetical protein
MATKITFASMKSNVFASNMLHAGLLLPLHFNPEDEGNTFLHNSN